MDKIQRSSIKMASLAHATMKHAMKVAGPIGKVALHLSVYSK